MKLAVMQPCYLPWRGYFALMKLADVFVHLDDVPLPQGRSFQTRVAIKTARGRQWLTVPVQHHTGQLIRDVQVVDSRWRQKHIRALLQELPRAAELVTHLIASPISRLAELNICLARTLADALDLHCESVCSSAVAIEGAGWKRILNLCKHFGATEYITGHGARHYFDHDAFDAAGVQVKYLDYDLSAYPQPHGSFDPYVSVLDVIEHAANPRACISAQLVPWRDFLHVFPTPHERACSSGMIVSSVPCTDR